MKLLRTVLLAVALVVSAPSMSHARAPAEKALVERAMDRGKLIYDFDQAAWHSTDVMLAALARPRLAEIKGWLVEPDGDALSVLYYGYDGDAPYGVFSARFKGGKVVSSREIKASETRDLTTVQQRMALARKVAMTAQVTPCTRAAFNTVIVPPASDTASVEVYLLSAQVRTGEYPFGGHYLVTVGPDGKIAGEPRPFMKSCMNQALPANAVAAMVSHLLDPTPTEIHAWLSRWIGKPVYVMVVEPSQLWEVTDKGMRKVNKP